MNREEVFNLLKRNLKNKNLIKHSLAVETAMNSLAKHFNQDQKLWSLCGLLHDIDYEMVEGNANLHSKEGFEMLKDLGFESDLCDAVLTHNEIHGIVPKDLMAKSLFCIDALTGLIVAATLVLPSKKINDLEIESILKRFKEKSFAKGASRENIQRCQKYLDLSLEKFVEIVLSSMQKISKDLEL